MNKLLQEYINWMEVQTDKYTSVTIKNRSKIIGSLLNYFNFKQLCQLKDLDSEKIEEFLNHIQKERKLANSSFNSYLNQIKGYQKYLRRVLKLNYKFTEDEYGNKIETKKVHKKIKKVLTDDELSAILEVTTTKKQKVLLLTFMYTGLRKEEILTLKKSQINIENNTITIKQKGGNIRSLTVNPELTKMLINYSRNNKKYVFENSHGNPPSTSWINKFLKILCKRAGVNRDSDFFRSISPHIFRAGVAMRYISETGDLSGASALLGHTSSQSIYAYINKDDLIKTNISTNMFNNIAI